MQKSCDNILQQLILTQHRNRIIVINISKINIVTMLNLNSVEGCVRKSYLEKLLNNIFFFLEKDNAVYLFNCNGLIFFQYIL